MVVTRINKSSVEGFELPLQGKRTVFWDDRLKGFGVRVTSRGDITYIVQHRIGGRGSPTKTYTIGKHGGPWTADTARQHAKDVLESIRKGIDPTDAKRATIMQNAVTVRINRTLAFDAYAEEFLNRRVTDRGLRREAETRSIFRRDLIPYFKNQPITLITKKDIDSCLTKIGKRSTSSANKAYRWLKNMFNCAVLDDDIPKSPVNNVKLPFAEPSRDRVLNDSEIKMIWSGTMTMGYPFGPLIQLLLTTGQRLREVAQAQWSEIDMESCEWTIPGTRTKNQKKHVVPLGKGTMNILGNLFMMRSLQSDFIFSTNDKTAVSGFSKAKKRLDVHLSDNEGSLSHWIFHDLRRTFATGCQRLGVPIEHTEALLNHSNVTSGLVGIYQRHDYASEKKSASDIWENHLCTLLGNGDETKK